VAKTPDINSKITADPKDFEKGARAVSKAARDMQRQIAAEAKASEQSFKNVTMAVAKIGAAVILAKQAFKLFDEVMRTTGYGADIMTRFAYQAKGAIDALGRSLVNNDFSNVAANIRAAVKAAGEKADMDDLNDARALDLSLRKSSLEWQIKELRVKKQEGTITKAEAENLKNLNLELYETEKDILASRINSKIKYAAESQRIDKGVFNDLQDGIIARSKLSEDELKELAKVEVEALAIKTKLRSDYTKVEYFGGEGGADKVKIETLDIIGYGKALETYLRGLSNIERAQVFEHLFTNEEEWKALIGNWNDLNGAMTNFQTNEVKINRSTTGLVDTMRKSMDVVELWNSLVYPNRKTPAGSPSYERTAGMYKGQKGIAGTTYGDSSKLTIKPKDYTDEITAANEQLMQMQNIAMGIANTFENLFSAGLQGWDEFGKAAIRAIEMMMVKLAAMGALYLALTYIPGFAGFMEFVGKISDFASGNWIQGKVLTASSGGGSGGIALKGRDLAWANYRSGGSLGRIT
jgi:hypothetical protein